MIEIFGGFMAKKKKKGTNNYLVYTAWALAFIAVFVTLIAIGYYQGYEKAKKEVAQEVKMQEQKRLSALKKLEELSAKKTEPDVKERLKEVLIKETPKYPDASHEYEDKTVILPPKKEPVFVKRTGMKPKLAIIIDDVSLQSHVNNIKALKLPLTMSFLPPTAARPNAAALAAKESFYMVHLPLEAQSFSAEESKTLRASHSQDEIMARVAEIKQHFPKVRYINNHTGSKFTEDELAVNRLIFALKEHRINFIDSRTTAKTMVPKVMKNYGFEYVARDVFLDHESDKESIKKQIKLAIKLAKSHGSAIAIGHPHANTIAALQESKYLFKDVDLVFVDKLY